MFERFTEASRQVLVRGQEGARRLKHHYIGTEHILLGLAGVEDNIVAPVFESLDITVELVRTQVVRIVGSGEEAVLHQIPFTPDAKHVLELALREALSLDHDDIGPEHILLGLVRKFKELGDVRATRILFGLLHEPNAGRLDVIADAETIRNEVIRRLLGIDDAKKALNLLEEALPNLKLGDEDRRSAEMHFACLKGALEGALSAEQKS